MMSKLRQLFYLACILTILVGASALFEREVSYYSLPSRSEPSFYTAFASQSVEPAVSMFANKGLIGDCVYGMMSLNVELRSEAENLAFANTCNDLADRIIAQAPTSGYAWYMKMVSAARRNDRVEFNRSYMISHEVAPNEQWVAEYRVNLTADHFSMVDPQTQTVFDRDIAMLVSSSRGIKAIAKRYIESDQFRERITNIVDSLSEQRQQFFVNRVKQTLLDQQQESQDN